MIRMGAALRSGPSSYLRQASRSCLGFAHGPGRRRRFRTLATGYRSPPFQRRIGSFKPRSALTSLMPTYPARSPVHRRGSIREAQIRRMLAAVLKSSLYSSDTVSRANGMCQRGRQRPWIRSANHMRTRVARGALSGLWRWCLYAP
jgi:hypothetical protein